MPEEPEHVLIEERIAALGPVVEMRADAGGRARGSRLAIITAGIAKIIMKLITIIDQTNSGMRLSDMPGQRCLNDGHHQLDGDDQPEISVKVIICDHVSMPLPGEYCGPESGT